MARNFTPFGPERQATNIIVNSQADPDAAVLTSGRFAVVYEHRVSGIDVDVRIQFLNADGTLSGNGIAIDQDSGRQISPVVAPRLDGGAVVVWHDINGFHGGVPITDIIQLRVVGANGQLSVPLAVADSSAPLSAPDVAMLADGRVVIVWQANFELDSDVNLRVLNAAGTELGSQVAIEGTDMLSSAAPAIAASGNKALIAYEDGGGTVRVKLFDGASGLVNSNYDKAGKAVSAAGSSRFADVAALTDGRYVVVWENSSNDDIQGRFVDAAGNPVGSVFTIANYAGDNRFAKVGALPDGGFFVAWVNTGGVIAPENGGDGAVLGRRFDSSGAAAGDLFLVNTGDPDNNQVEPTVAVNRSTGRTLIVWSDGQSFTGPGQDNEPPGIRGRVFQPTTDVINGTPGNDTITTYGLGETINGLGGNDTIDARGGKDDVAGGAGNDFLRGGSGDDRISGADGSDTILGGSENDILSGGTGADSLNGETGNDLLDGGLGNDTLIGGPGADRFAFTTAIQPKGSNIDTIADFSTPEDAMLLDNAIFKKLKTEGPLEAKFFEVGKKAKSRQDTIIYNDKTGDVLYDKNGKKKGGAVAFAKLEGSPDDIGAADFLVI